MTDIVELLRGTALDKDNFPRMKSEKWLPVGLAQEAADEIERLRIENWQLKGALGYEVPADIPEGNFQCGLCEARRREQAP